MLCLCRPDLMVDGNVEYHLEDDMTIDHQRCSPPSSLCSSTSNQLSPPVNLQCQASHCRQDHCPIKGRMLFYIARVPHIYYKNQAQDQCIHPINGQDPQCNRGICFTSSLCTSAGHSLYGRNTINHLITPFVSTPTYPGTSGQHPRALTTVQQLLLSGRSPHTRATMGSRRALPARRGASHSNGHNHYDPYRR